MKTQLYIGTSGWHYNHWLGSFYPADITGYNELKYHAQHFNSVENNSSFYRIAKESTYKTWSRMVPEDYRFSMKLNKHITHEARLDITEEVIEKIEFILSTTQILTSRLGALVIQLPPSFKYDLTKLKKFLSYFIPKVKSQTYPFDVAIEFRNKYWFNEEVYKVLRNFNVALVASQSSRYPLVREITADFTYIRMHGPEKLFASSYSTDQLKELSEYITSVKNQVKRTYVYFNNDFHGYALDNAKTLMKLCKSTGHKII